MKRRIWLIVFPAALCGAGVLALVGPSLMPSRTPEPTTTVPATTPPVDPIGWAGIVWQRVPNPFPADDPRPIRIDGIGAGESGLVGWGRVAAPGQNQFDDMGAVFVSTDGLRWRSIAIDDGVAAADTSELQGVAIGPSGLLAYGGVCCETEERAVWHSADGVRWTRAALDGDFGPGSVMLRVVGHDAGWVAVGTSGDQAALWTSTDGRTWDTVDPVEAALGKGVVSDVVSTPNGLVAVGTVDDAAGTHDGAIWISKDGTTWDRTAAANPSLIGPDETELWRVVGFGGGLFVVGSFGLHQERVQCEQLLGAVASLDGRAAPKTALQCGWGREHHWLSPDGSAWVRLPPPEPPPGQPPAPGPRPLQFSLLAAGGPGLVNLAEDSLPPESDSRIWVSADGIGWQPVNPPFPGPAGSVQVGIAIAGRQIIVVGEQEAMGDGFAVSIGTVP